MAVTRSRPAFSGSQSGPSRSQMPSDRIAQRLVAEAGVLLLPGTMFAPRASEGGDGSAERQLRIAFANADTDGIATLAARLRGFHP